jgi:AAA15 family ATPase/GTPase
VKIKKIKVHNLYSYDDAEFDLEDYNVIVGPNGAGKTNIVRILKLIRQTTSNSFSDTKYYELTRAKLNPSLRYKQYEESYLVLTVEFNKYEADLLLNILSLLNITAINESKDVIIAYYWLDEYSNHDIYPEILIRLWNGITMNINTTGNDYLTYTTNEFLNIIDNKPLQVLKELEEEYGKCKNSSAYTLRINDTMHLYFPKTINNILKHTSHDEHPNQRLEILISKIYSAQELFIKTTDKEKLFKFGYIEDELRSKEMLENNEKLPNKIRNDKIFIDYQQRYLNNRESNIILHKLTSILNPQIQNDIDIDIMYSSDKPFNILLSTLVNNKTAITDRPSMEELSIHLFKLKNENRMSMILLFLINLWTIFLA